ncbi:hypothetical protein SGLAM104S_02864 [Streptomyces glaucescens]
MSGRFLRLACTAAVTVCATLTPGPAATAVPEPGPPRDRTLSQLLTDLQRLYREAERATETYNATAEELKERRAEVARLDRALARARLSLHDSRGRPAASRGSSTRARAPRSRRTYACSWPVIRSAPSTRGM